MSIAKCFSRRALLRAIGAGAVATGVSAPFAAQAQVVRGIVVDEGSGRAMPGIVVVLLDSAGTRLAGVLADDAGRYAIRIAVPGRYAVRAERIGYRAEAPTPVQLAAGEAIELRLVTRPVPVVLGAVRVTGKTACVARASDGRDVSTVWDEARKALYATDLTQRQELFTARVSRFQRRLDVRDGRVISYESTQGGGVTRNPFVSLPAAELSANGFVRQGPSETTYYGPDAGVLLSDEFLADHCFKLRAAGGRRSAMIGIEFEPARGREKPEIAGTLWLDRKTAELRDLEYEYRLLPNLPTSVKSEDFGGRMEFRRMPTGAWIVQRWVIRMPVIVDKGPGASKTDAILPGMIPPSPSDRVRVVAIQEEGGEVIETVARGERRESVVETAVVRGAVFDSTRMAPLPNARVFLDGTQFSARSAADGSFTIGQVPPGTYALSVTHARFDSLHLRPPSASVAVRAGEVTAAQLAAPSIATIFARDCTPEERKDRMAVLRGHVRDGFNGGPVIDAQVTLAWNRLGNTPGRVVPVLQQQVATRTDSAGRYSFCGLPDAVNLTARVTADDRRSVPVTMVLPANDVSVLDVVIGTPVVVASAEPSKIEASRRPTAPPRNQAIREFDRRRRRGTGTFLTRAQIDKTHASRLTDLLRMMPGVSVGPSENGSLIVELRGGKKFSLEPLPAARSDSGSPPPPAGNNVVTGQLSVRKCPAAFLVDGMLIDGGAGVDLEMRPEMIEGIEVYSGAQVPMEYSSRHSECGLIMIWTRAFAERPDPQPGLDGER